MEEGVLSATSRDVLGKSVKKLRSKQLLPAVVYGHGVESKPVSLELGQFKKVYKKAGSSSLVDLKIDDKKPIKVLIQSSQSHYLTDQTIHVDLYAVKMTEKIEATIPLNFQGASPAVEELEGNLITNKSEINVRCLPADLIPSVDVDISVLKTFDDQIRVKDLNIPEKIEVLDDPDDIVASVGEPITEEELEAELAEEKGAEEAAVEELAKEEEKKGEEESAEEVKKPAEEAPDNKA